MTLATAISVLLRDVDAALAQGEHARLAADALAFRTTCISHLLGDLVQVDAP